MPGAPSRIGLECRSRFSPSRPFAGRDVSAFSFALQFVIYSNLLANRGTSCGAAMRETKRAVEDVLESFRSRKGAELVHAMATEIGALHQVVDELRIAIEQVQARQDLTAHMFSFGHDASPPTGLPTELEVLPQYLLATHAGFYDLEYTADGIPFRWTGPQRSFSFSVYVDRTKPISIRLEALAMIDMRRQGNICLHVDGTTLPFALEWEDTCYVGEAVLPAAPLRTVTRLTFALPTTLRVPDSTTDLRELGLGFSKLIIRPLTIPAMQQHCIELAEAAGEEAADKAAVDLSAVAAPGAPKVGVVICAQAFSFSAEQIADGHPGFFELESEQGGLPFRWSDGQSPFSFSLPIDRTGPIDATLKLAAAVDLQRQSPIIVVVDGETYSVPIVERGAGLLEARLTLPPAGGAKTISLKFEVPSLARKGKGRRRFGVAFRELILQPAREALPAADLPAASPKPDRSPKTRVRSTSEPAGETVTVTGM